VNRRSFFNRIARAAAIVALAPQIAFRAPKIIHAPPPAPYALDLDEMLTRAYALARARASYGADTIDIFTDRMTALHLQEAMAKHMSKEARSA
jgi:hypothetical protein